MTRHADLSARRLPAFTGFAVAVAATLFWPAAPARADDDDTNYLAVLHSHDISDDKGDQALISFAHSICSALAQGYRMDALEDVGDINERNGLSDDDVKVIVKAAAATYCPEYIR